MQTTLRTLFVLLTAIALAACGGDDGSSGGNGSSASADSRDASRAGACQASDKQWSAAPKQTIDPAKRYVANVTTDQGSFEIELLAKEAPITVNNFVFLASEKFYDCVPIHRIVAGFMFQTGDPTGTGGGGPGYSIKNEPVKRAYEKGIVAMANAGPDTGGSQFFVMLADYPLDPNYTIFGTVRSGMDVVDRIGKTPVTASDQGEQSKPTEKRIVQSITVSTA